MKSIRHRLLLSLLIGLLGSTALMVVIAYVDSVNELHDLFTDNLRRMAVVLKGQAFLSSGQDPADLDTGELEESYVIQIWDGAGVLLRSSRPDVPLPLQTHEGLSRLDQSGQSWDIYTLKAGAAGTVQIAQPQEIVTTMIGESAALALLPFIALFVLMAIGGWIAVGRSLAPLSHLSRTIRGWEVDNLQPIAVVDAPKEIQPIVSALNAMLGKLDKAMAMQQQFTADSAHELRTPLAAVKVQLENVARAPSDQERRRAVDKLSDGIDRCIHLASQLLTASRSMAVKSAPEMQAIRLDAVARAAAAAFTLFAARKQIALTVETDFDCSVRGDEEGLRALVSNLVDNALRYTPDAGQVAVRVSKPAGRVELEVSDDGPGIPVAERDKVFRRFYRVPGTPSTGSGLGLSIVRSVAEAHNATVAVLDDPLRSGTAIRVIFPAAAPGGSRILEL